MDGDVLTLGTEVGPWQIRDFSVRLREEINKRARQSNCKAADWLHGYFQKHGIDGEPFAPIDLAGAPAAAPAPAASTAPVSTAAGELASLVASAAALGTARRLPQELRQLLNASLIDQARRLAPTPANAPKRLAAPSNTV